MNFNFSSLRTYYCPNNCHPEEEQTSRKLEDSETEDNKILKNDNLETKIPEINLDENIASPMRDMVRTELPANECLESKTPRDGVSVTETQIVETEETDSLQTQVENSVNPGNKQDTSKNKHQMKISDVIGLDSLEVQIQNSENNLEKIPELITLEDDLVREHKKDLSSGISDSENPMNEDPSREDSPDIIEIQVKKKKKSICPAEVITLGSSTDEEAISSSDEIPTHSDSFALNFFNQIRDRLDQFRGLGPSQRGRGNERARGNKRLRPFKR